MAPRRVRVVNQQGKSLNVVLVNSSSSEMFVQVEDAVEEAPIDDKRYVRKNGAWVEQPGPPFVDAPSDGRLYARLNGQWVPVEVVP